MARKQKGGNKDSDGKHRKETREERRIRLEKQQEAREACQKYIPIVLGGLFLLLLGFSLWVRSVPPKEPPKKPFRVDPDFQRAMDTPVKPNLKVQQVKAEIHNPEKPAEETIEL